MTSTNDDTGESGQQTGHILHHSWSESSNAIHAVCNCPGTVNEKTLYTGTTSLPEDNQWIKLNDNLSARVNVFIYTGSYYTVPFSQAESYYSKCSPGNNIQVVAYPGTAGKVEIRIDKPILGESHFSGELVTIYEQLSSARGDPDYRYPHTRINADFTVTSTAECHFSAGDTFTVNLGNTSVSQLNIGAPPGAGYTPRQLDLSVDCTNIADNDLSGLEYTVAAAGTPNVDGPFIATNKAGIGVAMTDHSGNLIGLGAQNAMINSYHNGRSQAQVQFYPVIVPGEQDKVTPGPYSATATVTVTIP